MTDQKSDDLLISEIISLAQTCSGINMDRFDDIAAAIPKAKERVKAHCEFLEREIAFFENIKLVINQFYQNENVYLHRLNVRADEAIKGGFQIEAHTKPKV